MTRGALNLWIEKELGRAPGPNMWWVAALGFGVITTLISASLNTVFPQQAAAMQPGYGSPVIAFEFARSQADLLAIFGTDSDPLQVGRLAAMRAGNEQDYLFMLAYAAFLSGGLFALWRELRHRVLLAAAVLPIIAALCDAYENWLLFDIQAAFTLGEYSPSMASLPWPVAAKFLALTAVNIAIGFAMTRMARGWQLAGVIVLIPCLATVMALVAPAALGWTLLAAISAGWIGLLLLSAFGSWYALVRKAPLVDFTPAARKPRAADQAEPDAAPPRARRGAFGRRPADGGG